MKKIKKFNVLELLNQLPAIQKDKLKTELPDVLEVSEATFKRILYADVDSAQEISSTNLVLLSHIFNVPPEKIINRKIQENLKIKSEKSLKHLPKIHLSFL